MGILATASNSGVHAGACVLLEEKLGNDLVSLACRHHFMELMVVKVFDTLRGPISGPNIQLFQRFGEYWGSIDRSDYESVLKVDSIASALNPVRDDLIQFIQCSGPYRVSAKGRLPRASATFFYFSEQSPSQAV